MSSLKAYNQLGFKADAENDTQHIGQCPFCGKEKHFFVNKENLRWDCKKCGRSGGFQTFLRETVEVGKLHFKGEAAVILHRDRKLKIKTLRNHNIGYLSFKKTYILPIYNEEGKIDNIRTFNLRTIKSLAGCHNTLFNYPSINKSTGTLWLCEGEWDALALSEILESSKDVYLGVPGAMTFKGEWVLLFKDRRVNVLYDNDPEGINGSLKVYNAIKAITKELKFIHWQKEHRDGYDVRDLCSNGGSIKDIKSLLKDTPVGVEVVKVEEDDLNVFDGRGTSPEAVYKVYNKWFYLKDMDIIDMLFGVAIANRLPGDPVWLFLVGVPGCAKSELLMSISDAPETFKLSIMTPATLISGYRGAGVDPSLIPRLNGKVVIVKDFTTMLKMNQTSRDEIFAILRDAYDGECAKPFGDMQYKVYKSRFGIISGVTPVIDIYLENETALGERFLRVWVPVDLSLKGAKKPMRKAADNIIGEITGYSERKESQMRAELEAIGTRALNYDFRDVPEFPEPIIDKIICASQWVAMMRGQVTRDRYSKEVTHKPVTELGTRLTKQLIKTIIGITMFKRRKKVTDKEYHILKSAVTGSAPANLENIVSKLYKQGKYKAYTSGEISRMIGLPLITARRMVENLYMLKIMKKEEIGVGKNNWRFSEDAIELMEGAEIYE